MKTLHQFLIYFFGYFAGNIFTLSVEEYNVKGTLPSYLYRKFEKVKEDIFPRSIRVKFLSWKIPGTLIYSMDRRMNQLIVTLYDEVIPTIGIELSNDASYTPLSKICGCQICRFELLELQIEIWDKIYIECNNIKNQFKYKRNLELSEVYPLPYSKNNLTFILPNEAQLWMVNTPYEVGKFHNPSQLSGCIYNVWYYNEPINFTNVVGSIDNNCRRSCYDDICNGGKCLETFLEKPICNCTNTFQNGDYCNDTIQSTNKEFIDKTFQIYMFKVSWKSSSKEILSIGNIKIKIQICQFEGGLFFEYNYIERAKVSKYILTKTYVPYSEYILITVFNAESIDLQFNNNGSWVYTNLFSYINLRKEILTSIKLRSDDGIMEFLVKPSKKDTKWKRLDFTKSIKIDLGIGNVTTASILQCRTERIKNVVSYKTF